MPKKLELRLRREGIKKGFSGKRLDRYVFGTMNRLGLLSPPSSNVETLGNKPKKKK